MTFKNYCYFYYENILYIEEEIKRIKNSINYDLMYKYDRLDIFKNIYSDVKKINKLLLINILKFKSTKILKYFLNIFKNDLNSYKLFINEMIINNQNLEYIKLIEDKISQDLYYCTEFIIRTKNIEIINYFDKYFKTFNKISSFDYIQKLIKYKINDLAKKKIDNISKNDIITMRLEIAARIYKNKEMLDYIKSILFTS